MSTIEPQASLASLVLDRPGLAELLEQLDLDYCCHGTRSLAAACAERDLDVDTLVRVLDAHVSAARSAPDHVYDCRSASIPELCDHIVSAHHESLRRALPRLSETSTTVVQVHGGEDPRLGTLARLFDGLAHELLEHLDREERLLFPACIALETGNGVVDGGALLTELEDDHAGVGETLRALRELADGYDAGTARCGTHRALLDGLDALERDLHLHIHEENNVLFPRIRARLAAPDTTDRKENQMSTSAEQVLDVRPEPPAKRHELIFDTYHDLRPGQGFVLVNDHDPKPLRYQFEAEHAGAYTWDYLQQGPEVWRVRIGRPAA